MLPIWSSQKHEVLWGNPRHFVFFYLLSYHLNKAQFREAPAYRSTKYTTITSAEMAATT